MAKLTSTLTVRLIDAVSGPARAAARSINGIGSAVDNVNGRRLAIGAALNTMARDVNRATRSLQRNMNRLNSGIGMPAGIMGFFGARSVYDFEKASNALQAVTKATDEQRKAIQKYGRALNDQFPFKNAEIMGAGFELGRAGLNPEQILGTLRDTLNLALAGDIDLQESADIATNVLTAMRLPMKTSEQAAQSLRRVNDALSYAASNSNTDVRMMGQTFKYVGPMAAAAGLSIEEVAAASMVMARNGIRASEAGVAMRSALVRMVRPTKPMLAALARLNVDINEFIKGGRQIGSQDVINSLMADGVDASSFASQIEAALRDPKLKSSLSALTARLTDIIGGDGSVIDKATLAQSISDTLTAAGSEVDFFGFLQALREKGADLGDVARIFDARQGSRLITLLAGDLPAALAEVRKGAPGATDEMARIRMQGVVGEVAAFVASWENLFLAIADSGVLKTVTGVIQSITDGLRTIATTSPELLEFGTYAVMGLAVLGPLGIALGGVVGFFGSVLALAKLIAATSAGTIAVFRAAAAVGGGASAASAAASAGAGVAGAAAGRGGLLGRLAGIVRGAGAVGMGLLAYQGLSALAGGIGIMNRASREAWMPKTADDRAELVARQAEIDARLRQIEQNMHPAMRDAPNPERDRLTQERMDLQNRLDIGAEANKAAEAAAAGSATAGAFRSELDRELAATEAMVKERVGRILQDLSFTARPKIAPVVDGGALRGVHADVGVD